MTVFRYKRFFFFTVLIAICFQLSANDVYTYYLDSKEAYNSAGSLYAEYKLEQVFELSMLVNDYSFCRRIISDYSKRPKKNYSENLCMLFYRFAYSSNDPDLIEDIFSIIPLSLKIHLETVHHLYIEIISSEKKNPGAVKNMNNVLSYLPDQFCSFYESLLKNRNYYLFFTPMTFSENHEDAAVPIPYSVPEPAPKAEPAPVSEPAQGVPSAADTIIEKPVPENKPSAALPSSANTSIQVGSFTVKENAEELAKELKLRNFNASIISGNIQGTTYYRVIVSVGEGYTLDEYLELLYEHGYGGIRY